MKTRGLCNTVSIRYISVSQTLFYLEKHCHFYKKKNVSVNTNTVDVMYLVLMKNVFVIIRSLTQKVTSIVHKDDAAYEHSALY